MPKLSLICVGKLKEKYQHEFIDEYLKRLSKYFSSVVIEELPDVKIKDNASLKEEEMVIKKEGELIIKKLLLKSENSYVIALDLQGKQFTSVEFASKIETIFTKGYNHLVFVIGGSLGLDKDVLNACNEKISLSKMTFTHLMARQIILEQVYRAMKISNGEKYHK